MCHNNPGSCHGACLKDTCRLAGAEEPDGEPADDARRREGVWRGWRVAEKLDGMAGVGLGVLMMVSDRGSGASHQASKFSKQHKNVFTCDASFDDALRSACKLGTDQIWM